MSSKERVDALLGDGKPPAGEDTVEFWKAKAAEAERLAQSARVEQGRVAKMDARVKELEAENAKLRSGNRAAEIVAGLTDEERGEIAPDVLEAQARIAGRAADRAVGTAFDGMRAELEKMKQEREAERAAAHERMAADFESRIERRFPGFLSSIGAGGDKAKAWASFLVNNAASVKDAYARCDYNALVYHIGRFYTEVLDVQPPREKGDGATLPDPSASGGGLPSGDAVGGGKRYTAKEYDALDAKCMKLRRAGKLDEYDRLREELDSALSEGRVDDE